MSSPARPIEPNATRLRELIALKRERTFEEWAEVETLLDTVDLTPNEIKSLALRLVRDVKARKSRPG